MIIYSILGGLLLSVGTFFYGQHVQKAEDALTQQKAIDAAVLEHNEDVAIDMEAARAWGEANAAVRTRIVTIRSQANDVTTKLPAPVSCNLDDNRMGVLRAAVSAANDLALPAERLRDAVTKANGAR